MTYKYEEERYGLIENGEYECIIEAAKVHTTQNGKECLNLTFKIRDDIDQKYKGRILFESIWKEKDNPEFFNRKRINRLLGTQPVEDGETFDSVEDIIKLIENSFVRIVVKTEFNEYYGEDENKIAYFKKPQFDIPKIDTPKIDDDAMPF